VTDASTDSVSVAQASHRLLNFSVGKNDLMQAMLTVPVSDRVNRVTLQYELQALKIVTVGWALSFFMAGGAKRDALSETYWNGVRAFAGAISSVTSGSVGKPVDYFQVLKQRLDTYVGALNHFPGVSDPAAVVGPAFAMLCGCGDDPDVIFAGKFIFNASVSGVKSYLDQVRID
jgi:hypothetical protein